MDVNTGLPFTPASPGTRRHIQAALKAGATPEEIVTVLQICVSLGVEACAKGVPILAEELERNSGKPESECMTSEGIVVTAGKGCQVIRRVRAPISLTNGL